MKEPASGPPLWPCLVRCRGFAGHALRLDWLLRRSLRDGYFTRRLLWLALSLERLVRRSLSDGGFAGLLVDLGAPFERALGRSRADLLLRLGRCLRHCRLQFC